MHWNYPKCAIFPSKNYLRWHCCSHFSKFWYISPDKNVATND